VEVKVGPSESDGYVSHESLGVRAYAEDVAWSGSLLHVSADPSSLSTVDDVQLRSP
jgi:hypothetical protein